MTKCAVCGQQFAQGDYRNLSTHFSHLAETSDIEHVMWLNKNITKQKVDAHVLERKLSEYFDIHGDIKRWIKERFIARFYGAKPHPFVLALQHPWRETLLGYVVEHQHFLRQWTQYCAFIMAKTNMADVTLYELDNINTEFGGFGAEKPSTLSTPTTNGWKAGLGRQQVLATPPLLDTDIAIRT